MTVKLDKLARLRKQMAKADLPLKDTANNLVFGHGDPDAKMFFIGEAPGKNEDLKGLPFIGSAGKHLDVLFDSIKLSREDVYITSILKYRPPNNRPPKINEIEAHTPFLVKQILIMEPEIILPLGNFATRFVLAAFDSNKMGQVPGISTLHGEIKKITFKKHSFNVMPLYHPASVLYNFRLKKTLLNDFQVLSKFFKK